ncbi:hypothetical protein EV359DRAFT_65885 [Lentinula novae-zelandiae]|nr:hypothetical protein EV359DRAFT_65885 [Lentinula novae-zelandiae]
MSTTTIQKEAEKQRKNAERQRVLHAKRKAKKEAANPDSENHSDHEMNRHHPAKKAHVQAPVEAVEDVKAEMIAYIRIRKDIAQPAASGFHSKGRQPANPNPNDEILFSFHDKPMKSDGPTWDTGEGNLEDPFDISTVEAFTGPSSTGQANLLDVLCEKDITASNLFYL